MSNSPLGELVNLRQTEAVEEYQRQFQSPLARTTDLKPGKQVDLFTVVLVKELRIDIEMQQLGDLGVAKNMARALERSSTPFIKRLTREEMAERRAMGLYYNCDKSYSIGHKCSRLLWIEISYVEYEQDGDKRNLQFIYYATNSKGVRKNCVSPH
ncbi:hypothetical protein GOBAR_DD31225 [Gossypium barbadense]|nr:hypothetical protein GOBAR_DD31225 [Gossypium barbadense]